MGFLEPNPGQPGQTCIVAHNDVYIDTGRRQSEWQVTRLDTHHVGIQNEDYQLGGVRLRLNMAVKDLQAMLGKKFHFDLGEWVQSSDPMLPYATQVGATLIALSPNRYALQAHEDTFLRFENGLEEILGMHVLQVNCTLLLLDLN